MEENEYFFEAKTITRMEILVLSTLLWRMNPVNPLSFLDYIVRRLGFKDQLCSELLCKCEQLLLSVIKGEPPMKIDTINDTKLDFYCLS